MTEILRFGLLSGSCLKVIAIISMTIDHMAFFMLGNDAPVYSLMRTMGRLAFPIFAFLLVEGYVHTRDPRRYLMNLFTAALVSQIPWLLLEKDDSMNVMFTLLLGLMAVTFLDRMKGDHWFSLIGVASFAAIAEWLQTDYSWRGICLIAVFYMFRDKPVLSMLFGLPFLMEYGVAGSALGLTVPLLYSGQRGFAKSLASKYLFYAYYPVHLMVIWLLCL